jgi:hypothetical protein
MRNHRITHTAVVGVVVAALAAPGAAAQQDLRMPDTREAAAASTARGPQDLRMPDTRDAAARVAQRTVTMPGLAVPTPLPDVRQDLRSPDTRDIVQGRGPSTAPDVTVIEVPQPAAAAAGGIDWGDAGMGAAFMLVLAAAGILAVRSRRHRHPQTAISA